MFIWPRELSQSADTVRTPILPCSNRKSLTTRSAWASGVENTDVATASPVAYPSNSTEWKSTRFMMYATLTSFRLTVSESLWLLVAIPFILICCSPCSSRKLSTARRLAEYVMPARRRCQRESFIMTSDGVMFILAIASPSIFW